MSRGFRAVLAAVLVAALGLALAVPAMAADTEEGDLRIINLVRSKAKYSSDSTYRFYSKGVAQRYEAGRDFPGHGWKPFSAPAARVGVLLTVKCPNSGSYTKPAAGWGFLSSEKFVRPASGGGFSTGAKVKYSSRSGHLYTKDVHGHWSRGVQARTMVTYDAWSGNGEYTNYSAYYTLP